MKSGYCVLPFIHMEIQPSGGVYSCCHSNNPQELGHLHKDSLLEIWNGKNLEEFQNEFTHGNPKDLEHCKDCFYYESLDAESWRQAENRNWKEVIPKLEGNKLFKPKSISVRFSNLCNFSCRTCKPATSTGWFPDAKFLNPKGDYHKKSSTLPSAPMLSQLDPFIDDLHHLYFAGGEPLMEIEHYQILEEFIKRNPTVELSYDTNLSILKLGQYNAIEQWKNFKTVNLSASVDGFGPKGEYIRKGLAWDDYLNNWNLIKRELPHVRMRINFTLSIYNMFHVLEFIEEVMRLDMFSQNDPNDLTISLVEEPSWQSLQALPADVKDIVEKKYLDFIKKNIGFGKIEKDLGIALKYMRGNDLSNLMPTFRTFNTKIDLIRAEKFKSLFEEEASLLGIK